MTERFLIVNADDFGLSKGVNEGIIQAHEHGIVTSASLMVRGDSASEAAEYARGRSQLGVGLHVDLCEWKCVSDEWKLAYEVVPLDDQDAVAAEVERQLTVFRQLMQSEPDHLDSHQHIHKDEPLKSILQAHAKRLGVVLRHFDESVNYRGDFYGQSDKGYPYHDGISVESLLRIIRHLSPGITELACHPGLDDSLNSTYRVERRMECNALCDARVKAALGEARIQPRSFATAPIRAR